MPVFTSGGGQVGSAQINDGSIVNADINTNAAIALSKLASLPLSLIHDETFTDTDTTIASATFAAKKYLKVFFYCAGSGAGAQTMTVNNDTGANYDRSFGTDGGAFTEATAQANISLNAGNALAFEWMMFDIINIATLPKLIVGDIVQAGAQVYQQFNVWNNTTDAITSLQFTNGANFASGARLIIFGAD